MLTCKDFLNELTDYLDECIDPEVRAKLERHMAECPNCWVIADTTKKTIQIYKGMDPYPIPLDVETRLMQALEKKMAEKQK
ncbi:MAG: zf-HC2 domain-containing protein [Bryobacteraceae bacterium]